MPPKHNLPPSSKQLVPSQPLILSTKRKGQAIAITIRELLPPGTLILRAPITKTRHFEPPPIGGQLIILSYHWSHHAIHWYADSTNRGLLTGITISNTHTQLRLLRSYWSVPHADNQHLFSFPRPNRLIPPPDHSDLDQTQPRNYIQDLIMREVHKHQRNSTHQTILLGDLNFSWTHMDRGGTHPALQHWCNQMGWHNPSRSLSDAYPS
jgi:hypothetical protein